jgi:hypothetical protein
MDHNLQEKKSNPHKQKMKIMKEVIQKKSISIIITM